MNWKTKFAAGATILFTGTLILSTPTMADFSGPYDPANWTLTLSAGSNGFVDTTGAPVFIELWGSDNNTFSPQTTDYTAVITCDGNVRFDWIYATFDEDGSSFDPAGYLINGAFTQVTADGSFAIQNGNVFLGGLDIGDVFGWRVLATDDQLGPGAFTDLRGFAATCDISIDIKPGSDPNGVNPGSKGAIPVAILTTSTFDATVVDEQTLAFGPNGAAIFHEAGHVEDVDGDGDLDLLVHFKISETGIACGDTDATLTGQTFGGLLIMGTDFIKTAGC